MASLRTLALLASIVAFGCGDDDRGGVGGTDAGPGIDSGTAECTTVDTTCPDEPPAQAAPCEDGLSCEYTVGGEGGDQWRYDCPDGLWIAANLFCSHDGICVPPLLQRCRDPFSGTIGGVTVTLAPWTGPVRPFDAGEVVPLVWGPQGGAMIPFRIELAGDGAPACVSATVDVTVDGTPGPSATLPVALRCGLSQPVLLLLPVDCGGAPEHTLDLRAVIEGIGEATANVTLTGGDEPCAL